MPSYLYLGWNHRRPFFGDSRARRALTMAIDRQGIIDGLLYGHADYANSPIPLALWSHDPETRTSIGYDPIAAKRLLSEAGWSDGDGNGVVENGAGQEFRFTILVSPGPYARVLVAQKVQADLRNVGIAAEVRVSEFAALVARIEDPVSRDFDAVIIGAGAELVADDAEIFHCARRDEMLQISGFCDPGIDALLDSLSRIVDRATALPLWREYQDRIIEEQPYTFLFYIRALDAVNNRLRNVRPDARGWLVGIRDWWLMP